MNNSENKNSKNQMIQYVKDTTPLKPSNIIKEDANQRVTNIQID